MGADAYASEDGVFKIEVRDERGKLLDDLRIEGLDAEEPLLVETREGRRR